MLTCKTTSTSLSLLSDQMRWLKGTIPLVWLSHTVLRREVNRGMACQLSELVPGKVALAAGGQAH